MKNKTHQANSHIKCIQELSSRFLMSQSGTALIISLVILIVLTMIGIGGMKRSMVLEKMAGISWDANAAFQATEITLREAESRIESISSLASFDGQTTGQLSLTDVEFDYMDSSLWNISNAIAASGNFSMVEQVPLFTMKHVKKDVGSGSNNDIQIRSYEDADAGSKMSVFKITAFSSGRTEGARVILQTYYAKRF